ncbi:chromobox protein homolog 3-like [Symsagittifera roscoffensis]|uniref:chromobox protein homolog 3-like n=1 Tax=Symsagittifera roscoffensis TaxID=84072 RepID=UPI00307C992A
MPLKKQRGRKRKEIFSTESSEVLATPDELEVESILDKKFVNGEARYLLRWKGYDSSEDTWEPVEHLGCPALLEEFNRNWEKQQAGKSPEDDLTMSTNEIQTDKPKVKRPRKHKYQELQHDKNAGSDDDDFPTQVPVSKQSMDGCVTEEPISNSVFSNESAAVSTNKPNQVPEKVVKTEPKIFLDSDDTASEPCSSQRDVQEVNVDQTRKEPIGFARGCEPDCILGATEAGGSLKFLMKWKNCSKVDLVSSEEANEKCPKTVIAFYVKHLTWKSGPNPN